MKSGIEFLFCCLSVTGHGTWVVTICSESVGENHYFFPQQLSTGGSSCLGGFSDCQETSSWGFVSLYFVIQFRFLSYMYTFFISTLLCSFLYSFPPSPFQFNPPIKWLPPNLSITIQFPLPWVTFLTQVPYSIPNLFGCMYCSLLIKDLKVKCHLNQYIPCLHLWIWDTTLWIIFTSFIHLQTNSTFSLLRFIF